MGGTGRKAGAWLAAMAAAAFLLGAVVPWMRVASGGAETHEVLTAFAMTLAGLIWVFVSAVYFRRSSGTGDRQ